MRIAGLGRFLFAASFAVLGALSLASADFALNWQPVPHWVPLRDSLACFSGAVLLACGVGLPVARLARPAALMLTGFLCLWVVLLQLPRVAVHPLAENMWLGLCETLALAAGGWTIFSLLAPRPRQPFAHLSGNVELGQIVFAAALPLIGLSHIIYAPETASIVPAWLPAPVALAWFTGLAHIAAGGGILLRVVPRLAATLEAVMTSGFTVLIWLPMTARTPASRFDWTALCVSTAIAAAAWAVAESFGEASPRFASRPRV
ncbi:MAG TPA: hypothetical protein VII49_01230 [Rhizomicrobium sp.]